MLLMWWFPKFLGLTMKRSLSFVGQESLKDEFEKLDENKDGPSANKHFAWCRPLLAHPLKKAFTIRMGFRGLL